MFNYRIYTASNVFSYSSNTMSEAVQEFNRYRSSFDIMAIFCVREKKFITNNIIAEIGNLNNELF
jgi:hypothetical protein